MSNYRPDMASQFEQLLSRREAQLREQLRADHPALGSAGAADHEVEDFKDAAGQQAEGEVTQAQSNQAARELAQVLQASQRLRQGGYGICQACGEQIDLRRLQALPAVALCAACQQAQEAAPTGRGGAREAA